MGSPGDADAVIPCAYTSRAVVFLVAEHQRRERAERGDVPFVQHERLLERLLGFAPFPPARQKRAVVRPNLGLVARDEQTLLVPLIRRVVLVVNLVLVRRALHSARRSRSTGSTRATREGSRAAPSVRSDACVSPPRGARTVRCIFPARSRHLGKNVP